MPARSEIEMLALLSILVGFCKYLNFLSSMKRKAPKKTSKEKRATMPVGGIYTSTNINHTHVMVSVRCARQLQYLQNKYLSIEVKMHDELKEMHSKQVLCTSNQVDFQFTSVVDLKEINIEPNIENFYFKINLLVHNPESVIVGGAILQPNRFNYDNKLNKSLSYIANHTDVQLYDKRNKKIGVVTVTLCLGSIDSILLVEPSIKIDEIAATDLLEDKKIIQKRQDSTWQEKAIQNGYIPPSQFAKIWQEIAAQHGWKQKRKRELQIQNVCTFVIQPTLMKSHSDLLAIKEEAPKKSFVDELVTFALNMKFSIVTNVIIDIPSITDPFEADLDQSIKESPMQILKLSTDETSDSVSITKPPKVIPTPSPGTKKNLRENMSLSMHTPIRAFTPPPIRAAIKTSPSLDKLLLQTMEEEITFSDYSSSSYDDDY